jgi:MFS family permease
MNVVAVCVSFGVIGLFLPMTIYLQSVEGLTPLQAGLVMAPTSLASMLVAGPAGRLSDRFGGKFILMTGLLLYAAGALWLAIAAEVGGEETALLPAFVLAGIGFGCTFTPMTTEAMRRVPPHLSGAASGVNNTLRQVGSVLAGAAIGAILQDRLAIGLRAEAVQRSGEVPADYEQQFVQGFSDVSADGLAAGASQSAGSGLPASVSPDVAARIQDVAVQVFEHGFVGAMRPTMIVPVAVVLLGAVACLLVRGRGAAVPPGAAPSPGAGTERSMTSAG